ncbi:hypothetical protein CEP51_001480 [Fusarium floridanum]|uniref:Uncharacterized protein n=1 Tax=Fusarium floridanum TaxID=1325733 RepID=A0A428SGL1_9HYPO|nr:hypothetical protein CEP51_001480 [Fusarium floridanum]
MLFTALGAVMAPLLRTAAEIRPSCSLEYLSLPNTCAFSRIIYHLCTVSFVDPPWVNGVNGLDAGKDPATTDPGSVDIILALLTTATGKHMKTDMSIVVITFATGATARKVYMMRIMYICNNGDCPDAIDREYEDGDTTYCTSHKCTIDLCSRLRDTDKTSHGLGYLCTVCARTVEITRQMSKTLVSPLWDHYGRPAPTHTSKRRPGSE